MGGKPRGHVVLDHERLAGLGVSMMQKTAASSL